MYPQLRSGAISNGITWATLGYIPGHLNSGVHVSQLSDTNTSSQNYTSASGVSGLTTPISNPPVGSAVDYKIPTRLATNYSVTSINKKYDYVLNGTTYSLNTYLFANSTVNASHALYYHSGQVSAIGNSSFVSGYPAFGDKIYSSGYQYASSSYKPYSNTTSSTVTGVTVQISNLDGTANASTYSANGTFPVNSGGYIGIVFRHNGKSSVFYSGATSATTVVPPAFIAQNFTTYDDPLLGCHVNINFSGTVTCGTNQTCFVLDADEPYRVTQSPTTAYHCVAHKDVVLYISASNTAHALGTRLSDLSYANSTSGTQSSIIGTLTFWNTMANTVITRAVDIRMITA